MIGPAVHYVIAWLLERDHLAAEIMIFTALFVAFFLWRRR